MTAATILAALSPSPSTLADEPTTKEDVDPIAARLEKARDAHAQRVRKEHDKILKALDRAEGAARKGGRSALVRRIEEEREALANHGDLPAVINTSSNRAAIRKSTATFAKALQEGKKSYLLAKQDEKVARIDEELDAARKDIEFLSRPRPSELPANVVRGRWGIRNNELLQVTRDDNTLVLLGVPPAADYNVEFKAMSVEGSNGFSFRFFYVDDSNHMSYSVGGYDNSGHEVVSLRNGKWAREARMFRSGGVTQNEWHGVKCEIRGARFRFFLDDELMFDGKDDRFSGGQIGFGTWDNTAKFKDIQITRPDGKTIWRGIPSLPPI